VIDFQRLFHTGLVVDDLQTAMTELQDALGLTWSTPHHFQALPLWTPETGLQQIDLVATYSRQGPQHVELIQGLANGVYTPLPISAVHHVGVWVDDVPGEVTTLQDKGWVVSAAGATPEEGYGLFVYLDHPGSNMRLELVSTALMEAFERWWAGGSLD